MIKVEVDDKLHNKGPLISNDNDNKVVYDSTNTINGVKINNSKKCDGINQLVPSEALPHMRFLHYKHSGGNSSPHIDLPRRVTYDGSNRSSTHTFLLYLTNCEHGGCTNLLQSVNPTNPTTEKNNENSINVVVRIPNINETSVIPTIINSNNDNSNECTKSITEEIVKYKDNTVENKPTIGDINTNIIASIKPRRGRLLVFPHVCPHEGEFTIDVPKVLLRGEML